MMATLFARKNYDRRTDIIFYQAAGEQVPRKALMFKETHDKNDYLDPDWDMMELLAQCLCHGSETIANVNTAECALRSVYDGVFCFSQPLLQVLIELLPIYRVLTQNGWKFYFTINKEDEK